MHFHVKFLDIGNSELISLGYLWDSNLIKMGLTINPAARGLIFDLDGTLSDSLQVHLAVWNKLGDELGFTFDPKIVFEMTGMPTIAFAQRIISDNNLALDPHYLVRRKHSIFSEYIHFIRPVGKVADIVMDQLGKMPMAIGTGASRKSAMLQLKQLGFETYFDAIVTADDVVRHKPEPETFLTCARLMGVIPDECQVFEDGILGMEAARAAGMMVTDVKPFITYREWNFS